MRTSGVHTTKNQGCTNVTLVPIKKRKPILNNSAANGTQYAHVNIEVVFFQSHDLYNLALNSIGHHKTVTCIHMIMVIKLPSWMILKAYNSLVPILPKSKGFNSKLCCNLDIWPWKTIHCFLSSWWPSIQSCMILELTVHLYPAYKVFLLSIAAILTLDPRPWKTIGFFLSWWWSSLLSCLILELTVWSLPCNTSK
jgi:hypothetical protein